MQIGQRLDRKGDIIALNFIGAGAPEHVERVLGFGPGRLSAGYAVLALRDHVGIDDFRLAGMTYFSGGRHGLPLADAAADTPRLSVDAAGMASGAGIVLPIGAKASTDERPRIARYLASA